MSENGQILKIYLANLLTKAVRRGIMIYVKEAILMFDFSGFKEFDFNEGTPYISVTKNGVTFNKGVVLKLGCPEYVVLMINEESKQAAIKCCTAETPRSNAFYRPNVRGVLSVRWNSRDFLNTIKSMTGWDLEKESYRVEGQLLKEENAMLFDLNRAEALS